MVADSIRRLTSLGKGEKPSQSGCLHPFWFGGMPTGPGRRGASLRAIVTRFIAAAGVTNIVLVSALAQAPDGATCATNTDCNSGICNRATGLCTRSGEAGRPEGASCAVNTDCNSATGAARAEATIDRTVRPVPSTPTATRTFATWLPVYVRGGLQGAILRKPVSQIPTAPRAFAIARPVCARDAPVDGRLVRAKGVTPMDSSANRIGRKNIAPFRQFISVLVSRNVLIHTGGTGRFSDIGNPFCSREWLSLLKIQFCAIEGKGQASATSPFLRGSTFIAMMQAANLSEGNNVMACRG
jgi:hypothetical protein